MRIDNITHLAQQGLWTNNPSWVQLLGICPLLAISNTLLNGLSLGLATMLVMCVSSTSVSVIRSYIPQSMRIPIHILIAASLVTVLDILWHAYLPALYTIIGIFVPLIITNCIVLARIEAYASKNKPVASFFDALFMGSGTLLGLSTLGLLREVIGAGTIGQGIQLIHPQWHPYHLIPHYSGFLLMSLPTGAFWGLACCIIVKNLIQNRSSHHACSTNNSEPLQTIQKT